jgi:hypothetical protein
MNYNFNQKKADLTKTFAEMMDEADRRDKMLRELVKATHELCAKADAVAVIFGLEDT